MPDAVLYRAMQDIQAAIQGADLPGLQSTNVVINKIPNDRNQSLPAVIIGPLGEELPLAGLNDRDDVTYNILVAITAADNQDQVSNFELYLNWRQNIRRLFHRKQIGPRTTECVMTLVKPLATVYPDAWYANLFLSMLQIEVTCREARTQA